MVYAVASRVLRYPDEDLISEVDVLTAAATGLDERTTAGFLKTLAWLGSTPLLDAQAEYVATFDLKRKCCLYLTYYLNGDTRRRGEALWQFQASFRDAGWDVVGELPDYLPAVLELAATGGEQVALELLGQHRAGIRVLAEALGELASPYEGTVRVLDAVLPASDHHLAARVARLIVEGPPSELVGIDPGEGVSPSGACSARVTVGPIGTQPVYLSRKGRR